MPSDERRSFRAVARNRRAFRNRHRADSRLAQDPRTRQPRRCRRADARDRARRYAVDVRRREEHTVRRLRYVGAVHRSRFSRRPCSRLAGAARSLDRRAQRHGSARRFHLAVHAPARGRARARGRALSVAAEAAVRESRRKRLADALRAARHRDAGDGVRRDPREPEARCGARIAPFEAACRPVVRRVVAENHHARVRARRGRARPRDHPEQHQPSRIRADDHRPQFPGEDQREHRQLGCDELDRRGSRENGLGDPLGRRHGHGSFDRQAHPRNARVDPAQFAGADRHGADLPGAREGRRRRRGPRPGNCSATR